MTLRVERLSCERPFGIVELEAAGQPHSSWSSAQLDEAFKDERASFWGACEAGSLFGYALLYRLPFEAELQTIIVASRARRRGIARALLERLCDEARDWQSERLLLEVRESNQAARALYAQADFVIDGHRRGYYRGADGLGEDALLMSKTLK